MTLIGAATPGDTRPQDIRQAPAGGIAMMSQVFLCLAVRTVCASGFGRIVHALHARRANIRWPLACCCCVNSTGTPKLPTACRLPNGKVAMAHVKTTLKAIIVNNLKATVHP